MSNFPIWNPAPSLTGKSVVLELQLASKSGLTRRYSGDDPSHLAERRWPPDGAVHGGEDGHRGGIADIQGEIQAATGHRGRGAVGPEVALHRDVHLMGKAREIAFLMPFKDYLL